MRIMKGAVLACALIVIAVGTAQAQDLTGTIGISPQIGVVVPTGDFGDSELGGAKTGFSGGISGEYYFTKNIAAGAKVMYDRFGMDTGDEYYYGEGDVLVDVDGNWTMIEFGGYLKYVFVPEAKTRFFGRAGLIMGKGKGTVEGSALGITAEATADVAMSLGLELGVGVMHMLKENMALFGEIGFTHVMTDGKDVDYTIAGVTSTYESDINTQWFGVKAGMTFFLGGK